MNILFEFSRGGLEKNKKIYETIKSEILKDGHKLTNDLLKKSQGLETLPEGVYERLTKSISAADGVIIEGSVVSLSLGYVLTTSINLGKPVLFLINREQYNKKNRFVSSIQSKLLTQKTYDGEQDLKNILKNFFHNNKNLKVRFNLVMPNDLHSYLIERVKETGMSRTKYLRTLIRKDKQKNSS